MKKVYEAPVVHLEQFVANEYIAACGESGTVYKFKCDAGKKSERYAVKDANGNIATISGMYMDGEFYYYNPCGDTHEAESDSGFLFGYHIDDVFTRKDENIPVVIWTENNRDVHCTTALDMDLWETAKS